MRRNVEEVNDEEAEGEEDEEKEGETLSKEDEENREENGDEGKDGSVCGSDEDVGKINEGEAEGVERPKIFNISGWKRSAPLKS